MYRNFMSLSLLFVLGVTNISAIGKVYDSPECPPLPYGAVSVSKTGQKAWDKCIEFSEVVYPCKRSPTFEVNPPLIRTRACLHAATPLILGGADAGLGEFPHMALLGYGEVDNVIWSCSGSLISNKWILTAAHCAYDRDAGSVKYVKLGGHNIAAEVDPRFLYKVAQVVTHPDYLPPVVYNDIALLELDREVELDEYTRPACLHTGAPLSSSQYIHTGWGVTNHSEILSDVLQKVLLEKFSFVDCSRNYYTSRMFPYGLRDTIQMCAGHRSESKDTCKGDGGGPLMVYNQAVDCTYLIVGVSSTGKACGVPGVPSVYTRVAAYVPWIESIVWP